MKKSKTLEKLSNEIIKFARSRGWKPSAEDLAKSIIIESAELLEKFQWGDSRKNKYSPKEMEEISEEAADVFIYLAEFCNEIGINLNSAVQDKINKNEKKYPEHMFKGKHNEEFYMKQKKKYRQNRKKKETK